LLTGDSELTFAGLLSPLCGFRQFGPANPWLTPGAICCRGSAAEIRGSIDFQFLKSFRDYWRQQRGL